MTNLSELHPMELDRGLLVQTLPSAMGGGWVWGLNDPSREYLALFFDEQPAPITPLGGREAHILEPHEIENLADCVIGARGKFVPA